MVEIPWKFNIKKTDLATDVGIMSTARNFLGDVGCVLEVPHPKVFNKRMKEHIMPLKVPMLPAAIADRIEQQPVGSPIVSVNDGVTCQLKEQGSNKPTC